jgi:uncharacterized protein YjbI with pentapeptide repeats
MTQRNFRKAKLRSCCFKDQDFSGADFSGADIRGANFTNTNVRVSVLAELYFIDVPVSDTKDWSIRGGEAIARAILKWLRKTS